MRQSPQLLITGANGFTGQHACPYFSKLGYDVTAVVRSSSSIIPDGILTKCCDLTNKNDVKLLIEKAKPDFLLHLAGQNNAALSWGDPITTIEANILSTAYLIDAIRSQNRHCKIIIVGSALQFDPNQISTVPHPYSLSKTLQILIAKAYESLYQMDIVIAKPSNLIGPGRSNGICSILANKINQIEAGRLEKVIEVHNLYTKRDFIDVRDVIGAYETLFKVGESGEIYNIASGKHRSIGEIIEFFNRLTSTEFNVKSTFHSEDYDVQDIDTTKLQKLGWCQTYQIEASLLDTLNYYRNTK